MAELAGIIALKVNGNVQRVKGSVKINMGGVERTMIEGNLVHGATSKIVHGEMSFSLVLHSDTDLTSLQAAEGATILVELDNGRSFVMTGASTLAPNEAEAGAGENEGTIVLGGQPVQEL